MTEREIKRIALCFSGTQAGEAYKKLLYLLAEARSLNRRAYTILSAPTSWPSDIDKANWLADYKHPKRKG